MKFSVRFALIIIVCLLVVTTSSCGSNHKNSVAEVNGEIISLDDFNREVAKQTAAQSKNKEVSLNKTELKKKVLEQMILQKIELQEARKKKLLLSDKDLDKKINEIKALYKSENNFNEMLKAQNISLNTYKEDIKFQLSKEALFNNITKSASVTDTDLDAYYRDNPKETLKQKARVISVSSQNRSDAEAKAKAEDIAKQLAGGASFAQLAKTSSDDKSTAAAGGLMQNRTNLDETDYIYRGQMGVEIDNALSKLNPGEYTREPFKANNGYMLVMLEDQKQMSKGEFKGIYQGRLLQQSKLNAYNKFISSAKAKAKIKTYLDKK